MAAIAGYGGSVLITASTTPLISENLVDAGDHKTFNEGTASKRYWDNTYTFTVQTSPDGTTYTTVSPTTYTIRYVSGQIVLNSALSGTLPSVRVLAGAYLPYSTLGTVTSWEATPNVAMLDNTTMGNGRWMTYQAGLAGATVKIAQFFMDTSYTSYMFSQPQSVFIPSMLTGRTTTERWEGYARTAGDDVKTAVNQLVTENLSLTVTGQFYYFP